MLVLYDDWIKVFKTFLSGRKWLEGLGYGFLLLVIGSTISLIFNLIRPSNENLNQQNIEGIVDLYPLISVLVFGIIGPIFEELTYRAGLFNILNRWNKVLAYLGTSIFFGLIHFNLSGDIVGELINLPSYIVSGLLLCYFYDYGGFGAACIAHITNNLVGILIQIIL